MISFAASPVWDHLFEGRLAFDRGPCPCYIMGGICNKMHEHSVAFNGRRTAFPPLDPARVWAEKIARSHHRARLSAMGMTSEQFWDRFDRWPEYQRYIAYPGGIIERILRSVAPDSTVLDIGAGSGALTIPLARAARSITAVEPSSGQIARMQEAAVRSGISNLTVIPGRWEDVSIEEIGRFDIVTAGYCLHMEDICPALEKMRRAARGRVFLVHFAGHDLVDDLARIAGQFDPGPDHRDLLAVLSVMGYRPVIEILHRNFEIPLDLQLEIFTYTLGLSLNQQEALAHRMRASGRVQEREGRLWVKRWYDDALIVF